MIRESRMNWLHILAIAFFALGCVQPNSPESGESDPVITDLSAESSMVRIGNSTTITVTAEDPLGDPLTYHWRATAGDFFGRGSSVQYTASPCCTGLNRITVTVRNGSGGSTSQNIFIDVQP
jgi:hypothetical protein